MPNDDHEDNDDTPPFGNSISDTDRLPVIEDDTVPEGTVLAFGTSGDVAAVVDVAPPAPPKPPAPSTPTAEAVKATGARWVCSGPGCGATWKADPGPWHTHEHPVPGSKSRVTYDNHAITKVEG